MSLSIFFLVLGAALLHASWNIIVKGGSRKLFETALNSLGGCLGALPLLPFLPLPDMACLPYLAVSCVFHLAYYFCVAAVYKTADLSLGYTVMRGAAPILTALAMVFAGFPLGFNGWLGILLLCAGIFTLAWTPAGAAAAPLKGIVYSLRTSVVIMCYTLADGFGARASANAISYACWIFFLNALPINLYIFAAYGREYRAYFKTRGAKGLFGGICGLLSYGIVIWAMTRAPIALVEALRETSVIFGMILAVAFLGEKLTLHRAFAVILVSAGAIAVRLGG